MKISECSFFRVIISFTLNEIKPHINSVIVEKSYRDVCNIEIIGDLIPSPVSNDFLHNRKGIILNKIIKLILIFSKTGSNDNSRKLIVSLGYLKSVLMNEELVNPLKNDLLNLISEYLFKVEEIYSVSECSKDILKKMNLNDLNNFFEMLKDYIVCELDIYSGFSESDNIYEEYYIIRDFILTEFVSKHDELVGCELFFEDEIGNPSFEYYILSEKTLPFEYRQNLTDELIGELYEFCRNSNLENIFKTISLFLVKRQVF